MKHITSYQREPILFTLTPTKKYIALKKRGKAIFPIQCVLFFKKTITQSFINNCLYYTLSTKNTQSPLSRPFRHTKTPYL